MWIQVSHPDFFGGTWPTAPDPGDFRNFAAGSDFTRDPPPNFYFNQDGSPRMFIRMGGRDTQSLGDLARQERVLGDYGGQLASFEWVFSPRGQDGRPMPLFDRDSGERLIPRSPRIGRNTMTSPVSCAPTGRNYVCC